jgi:hypothetical protein
LLQYSILQHYEVCKTPLLDVTQSLKAACSFAILDNKDNVGYIYVLGIPYMTGRISVDSEEYITNVRLLSIGCSLSKRPFFQEGYLVQTEFTTDSDIKKGELDFNRRLIAIYKFNNNEKFWGLEKPIRKEILYPEQDKMKNICEKIKKEKYYLSLQEGDKYLIGEFLYLWNSLEELVRKETKNNNFMRGISTLVQQENILYEKNRREIDRLRNFRNTLVHETSKIKNEQLEIEIDNLKKILKELNISYQ